VIAASGAVGLPHLPEAHDALRGGRRKPPIIGESSPNADIPFATERSMITSFTAGQLRFAALHTISTGSKRSLSIRRSTISICIFASVASVTTASSNLRSPQNPSSVVSFSRLTWPRPSTTRCAAR
jgi:hypothetical protein